MNASFAGFFACWKVAAGKGSKKHQNASVFGTKSAPRFAV
jgi:hypothetical protein